MRSGLYIVGLALALVIFASGCGGGQDEEAPSPPAATATTAEDTGPIVFVLSGGEGRWDELVVEPDGSLRATYLGDGSELGTAQLSPEELDELRGLLDGSGLFTEDQLFQGEIVDDVRYEVTYRAVTITADSSAAPEALLPATARLQDLLDSIVFGDG
jgi:hypothetical protein